METIEVQSAMLEHFGLEIDLSEIMGDLNYLVHEMMDREIDLTLEDLWGYLPDLDHDQLYNLACEKLGEDLDPFALTDFNRLLPVLQEYAIQYFLDTTELHGVIDITPREGIGTMGDRLCRALDPFSVYLTTKPIHLFKAWIDQVGGSVDIDQSRYGRHVTYSKDQAVTIEVLREMFDSHLSLEGNIFAFEDFSASVGIGEFMRIGALDEWKIDLEERG